MEKISSGDYFIITVCTHDNRANCKGLENMFLVAMELAARGFKRRMYLNVSRGSGLANTRTAAVRHLKELFLEDMVWTFWLDSDICVYEKPETIADYVMEAERSGMSFAGATRTLMAGAERSFMHNAFERLEDGTVRPYPDEVLVHAKPFELKLASSGFALAYLNTPVDYVFHTEGFVMEDENFYRDNPDIDLRFCPIDNAHEKEISLDWSRDAILKRYPLTGRDGTP